MVTQTGRIYQHSADSGVISTGW